MKLHLDEKLFKNYMALSGNVSNWDRFNLLILC